MFCKYCNNIIEDGSNFCPICGSNLVSVNQTSMNTSDVTISSYISNLRQSELQKICDVIAHFTPMRTVYNEYDKTARNICDCHNRSKAPLIWGLILSVFSFIGIMNTIMEDSISDPNSLIYIAIFLVPGTALLTLFFVGGYTKRKELETSIALYCELSSILMKHYKTYEDCPVGPQYTNPDNLLAIKNTIISGRADSIKEALNILIDYSYRKRVQDYSVIVSKYIMSTHKNISAYYFSGGNLFQ